MISARRQGPWSSAVAALLACALAPAAAELAPLTVGRITPAGDDVPAANQIVIEFDRPVVPLGRMERRADELPVSIAPQLDCHWRWLDRQTLACNLDAAGALAPATRYTVTVRPGLQAMDGATMDAAATAHFITERPAVAQVWFRTWKHPGWPVLRAVFNQPVTRQSVEQRLTLRLAGAGKGVAVSAAPDPDDREAPVLLLPGGKGLALAGRQAAQPGDGQPVTTTSGEEARRSWLLEPAEVLPLNASVQLELAAGLVSALGPEPGLARSGVLAFDTFGQFRLLGLRCVGHDGQRLLLAPGRTPGQRCDPLGGFALAFSAPVLVSDLKRALQLDPDLAGGRVDYDPWASQRDYSRLGQPYAAGGSYDYWLPERLQAWRDYRLRLADGDAGLRDEFGRPLAEPAALDFRTDHRRPDFRLVHHDAVLESGLDSAPPLYVTNLAAVRLDYRALRAGGVQTGLSQRLQPARVPDLSFAVPLPVRDLLQGASGAVVGTIDTSPAVPGKSHRDRRFFAQVTPYQVHIKLGHFNTLVWVTDLASGEPVAGARVSIYRDALSRLGTPPGGTLAVATDPQGTALLPGTQVLDPGLGTLGWGCGGDHCERLFVRVDGAAGMALLPLSPDFRVDVARASGYRLFLSQRARYGHLRSWGTTAQGVYRAGDTIQYKLYVRGQDNERLVPAPPGHYRLQLIDPAGKVVQERAELTLDAFGALQGEYRVPESGMMGWYQFQLKADFTDHQWQPMRVLVSDFTPAAFRVESHLNGELFRFGDTLRTTATAAFYAGGAYTQAEARVTVRLRARPFRPQHPLARGFAFDTANPGRQVHIHQSQGPLSPQGSYEDSVALTESGVAYGRLLVESAVRDDRGQFIAATAAADYVAIDRLVGLRKDRWLYQQGEPAAFQYLAVDERGEPVGDTDVSIVVERLETHAARVRGAGNAYITRFTERWEPAARCDGRPARAPEACIFTPAAPGRYRIVASVEDTHGRPHSSTLWAWVAGPGELVWHEEPGHTLTLVPEQDSYRIGDTARFLVKNPFPGATALVTLERYGVLRQWQTRLQGNTPILEFPVDAAYAPGAYLSVLVFSPRVAPPPGRDGADGALDLGKPAFRIGYAELAVDDPYKQLRVTARTDRDSYKPRETVAVALAAEPAAAGPSHEPVEYAVAVLDEAVFDLIADGRAYFDPYRGFYSLDGLDVDNYSLLTRLVGRQRFEQKGATSGGDGGAASPALRNLFRFVTYWNPALRADAEGRARFEFTLPDNLTGWRVLAMAATPTDRFGLGEVGFRTHQPTELRPVMPNQVSEGDRFEAGIAVMNRTDQARTLSVTVQASGDIEPVALLSTELKLGPFERRTVSLPLTSAWLAPDRDRPRGQILLQARARDERDGDALEHRLPVLRQRTLEVVADYGSTTDDRVATPVLVPPAIHTDVGDVSVQLSASVIGNAEGAFRYLRDYDYSCWEQRLSRAVMASHFEALKPWLDAELQWPDSHTLPAAMLQRAAGYQAPNGGMSYFVARDDYASPYLSAYTALAFNWLRRAGHEVPAAVESRLHAYLSNLLRRDELPGFYTAGMASSVRAVALNALAGSGSVGLDDLRRHARHLAQMDLFGAANLFDAAQQIAGADAIAAAARDRLASHRSASAGKLSYTEQLDDSYRRILATPARANCAILSALARAGGTGQDELAAMMRAIVQTRGDRGHWENTQENLFCMNALVDYAGRAEAAAPDLRASAWLDDDLLGRVAFDDYREPARTLTRPLASGDAGRAAELILRREGRGRLYYATRLSYAPLQDDRGAVNAGIDIRRELSVQRDGRWLLLEGAEPVRQGELLRVDLFLSLPTARNFVVVDDRVAGGLEPVNRDLATASGVDAEAGDYLASGGSWWFQFSDWVSYGASRWSFYHRELRHDAVRFYADYLPAGRYHLSYTAQAIAAGDYALPPAQAAEMYDSDIHGSTATGRLRVLAAP